ncbi:MAG: non-canonical purine NTP pyrophosphatase [Gemmatimonadaceae bacterium]
MSGAPSRVVLATRSAGKRRELAAFFASQGIAVDDLSTVGLGAEDPAEDALETYETFEENARAKASYFAARLHGHVVVADDSGLEVAALGGAPGVRSKRWTGAPLEGTALDQHNVDALLAALEPDDDRRARYVSVVVARDIAGREWIARGETSGRILRARDGDAGFGYDPIVWSDDLGASFGRVSQAEKDRVSHRGRAFRALVAQWRATERLG